MADSSDSYQALRNQLQRYDQQHVLQFWEELDQAERAQLQAQLDELDLDQLAELVSGEDTHQDFAALASKADPPPAMRADGTGAEWTIPEAADRGEQALRDGKLGVVIVAGGQGTRLGFDQPKGMFPIGPVSGRTLFQFFADRLQAICQRYEVRIPLFVMTSEATDEETRNYFEQNNYLGLNPDDVTIFKQGTMPAVDAATGKLLLASKSSLALSPDGHGGTVGALQRHGCLAEAERRGIEQLAYIQVDNPLVELCDPTLIGHHLLAESEMTTQVIRKRYATERVGNVVSIDGKVQIIEYSDLPEEAAQATDQAGQLKLWAGNIAVHVIDVDFLKRMAGSAQALPFHRAHKKVPFVDSTGQRVEPSEPNATKFERFIFDLLPQAKNAFVVEARASEAFAPVKNADGAEADTPELAKTAISNLHRRWLEDAGAVVDQGIQVEINPRFALYPEDVNRKISPKLRIVRDQYFDD